MVNYGKSCIVYLYFNTPYLRILYYAANLYLAVTTPFHMGLIICNLIVCSTSGTIHSSTMILGRTEYVVQDVLRMSLLQ